VDSSDGNQLRADAMGARWLYLLPAPGVYLCCH